MEPFGIGMAGLGVAGLSTLGAFGLAFRQRRRRQAVAIPAARAPRSAADRLEALAAAQADLALRLDTLAVQATAPEERLQAMAGQLLGLIRDKNATLETALAGLDQLRARMRALEQMGEPAEARALLETLGQRLDGLQAAQAASAAGLEARLAALAPDSAGLADRLAGLDEKRAAGAEALLGRLTPLETRLAALESGREAERAAGRDALKRLEARLDALGAEQGAARADLATLKAEAAGPVRALGEQLTRVLAQKEALAESLLARIAALEAELAARDQGPALDRLADRLEALRAERAAAEAGLAGRLAAIEGAENPFAAISDQLTRLYAQKDATVETVFSRLAPLEARLAALDPSAALDRFAERLEAVQGRVAMLEGVENPFAEISGQLTALYGQKDAGIEAVLTRLAPLEARLAELDPSAALDRFAERLEAVQGRVAAIEGAENPFAAISDQLTRLYAQKDATVETVFSRLAALDPSAALDRFAERLEAVQGRVAAIEGAENPFAEISDQLTRLYAQKDATVETVFARLAPLEAKLAALDPSAALDRFAERLEAVQGRVATLEGVENPFAEISGQLTALYGQKDAGIEAVLTRLAPLEARLAELDPSAALDRFAERLEAVQGRVAMLEGVENPFAEISGQLTALYGQKDAGIEAVLTRLAPLEARLAELDPSAALDRFAERLEAVQGRVAMLEGVENPFAAISDQLTRLYAQKDATVETVFARLAPLEAQLALLALLAEDDPRASLDGLRARLDALHWAQGETAAGLAALAAAAGERAAEGGALSEIADRLTRLFAQKDAGIAALLARLTPLETRLAAIEARPWDPQAEAARAEAQAAAAELVAARAASDATALFADRIAELEASLPRLAAPPPPGSPERPRAVPVATPAELEAIWSLPRIVSLHQK